MYRLIDPRDGETFYVGKGKDNRVFSHISAAENRSGEEEFIDDPADPKMSRIRAILGAGRNVEIVIHRHGMSEETALEVESALIDAYSSLPNSSLANLQGGVGKHQRMMHVEDVFRQYEAKPADIKHKVILINVNKTAGKMTLYDAVRYCWKINKNRAAKSEYVLAVSRGFIIGAFVAKTWLDATMDNCKDNFSGQEPSAGRVGFVGRKAPEEIAGQYVGKSVPDPSRGKRGAANPIRYAG